MAGTPMGLIAYVFRNERIGSSLNQIHGNEVLIVGPGIPETFEAGNLETVVLELSPTGYARCVPHGEERWTMFGGSFVYTTDSRFTRAIEALSGHYFTGALPLHDRVEGAY